MDLRRVQGEGTPSTREAQRWWSSYFFPSTQQPLRARLHSSQRPFASGNGNGTNTANTSGKATPWYPSRRG
ncbi:hypothetical protein LZ31DRAFT_551500 [Colletotrichum somersetense]|nr:hypothetical protein LZ31DRAFT_551500 [Colletotrichum somersetense]